VTPHFNNALRLQYANPPKNICFQSRTIAIIGASRVRRRRAFPPKQPHRKARLTFIDGVFPGGVPCEGAVLVERTN
jgi:hypothetical protein